MLQVLNSRVKETASFSGTTSPITLLGAVANFLSFTSQLSNGQTTYYAIIDDPNGQFEIGVGIFTSSGTTLTRTRVIKNSSGTTALINFTAGTKTVFIDCPDEYLNNISALGFISAKGGLGY